MPEDLKECAPFEFERKGIFFLLSPEIGMFDMLFAGREFDGLDSERTSSWVPT